MDVTMTEKQWEEILKYFGFSKKRRMYYNAHGWKHRLVVVVSPDNEIHEEELEGWPGEKVSIYPKPTFETIYKWIFPQLISWSIEKDNKGYLWIKMDLKTQKGRIYSQDYLDVDSDICDIVEMIGEMLLKMIR